MNVTSLNDTPATAVRHNPKVSKQVLIPFGRYDKLVQFAQATFPPGESAPSHHHDDMIEVFLVQSGNGEIIIDGKRFPLIAGTQVTVDIGESHCLTNTGATDLVVTFFAFRP